MIRSSLPGVGRMVPTVSLAAVRRAIRQHPHAVAGSRPTAAMVRDPFFVYTTGQVGGGAIAASQVATAAISIQAADHFLCYKITAQYDQNDWLFRVNMGGTGVNLFNVDIRGALLFGPQFASGFFPWPRGMDLEPPMLIPSNSTVTFTVTNGATGNLNIFFALVGNRVSDPSPYY